MKSESLKAYRKQWYLKNKERCDAVAKAYHIKHPEVSKKAIRKYCQTHRDEIRERDVQYRKNHGDKVRAASLRWRNKNLEKARANEKRWRLAHPEYTASKTQKRWALKRTAKINLIAINEFIHSVKTKRTAVCYYCEKVIRTKGCHFDHIIPLSKGGAHAVGNLCVSCPNCNHSKHNKSITAWARAGQQILPL